MRRTGMKAVLSGFLLVLFLFAAASAQESYVVGFSAAMTGPAAETYAPMKDAFDAYFKDVNAKGGINGHPVKIIFEDDGAQPSKAAALAKKLISQDKVVLLMLASLSSTYPPVVGAAKQANVPVFFAGAVCPPEVYPPNPDSHQFCSTAFASKFDSRFAVSFINGETKGSAKLGLVAMNIPISRGEIDFAEELAKGMGIKAVDKEVIPPGAADFTPYATKIKNGEADWVYAWAPWGVEIKTFEALRKLGWKGKYIAWGHLPAEEELRRLKDDNLYVFTTDAFFSDNLDVHKKIMEAASAQKAVYPYTYLSEGWIGAMVLEEILKKTPWPPTPEKVRAAMNQVKADMKGMKGGPLTWTQSNHFRPVSHYRVYKWDSKKNGIVVYKDWTPIEVK
jgi:branched-chain amino acid transport system substrate-binding protein